MGPSGSGKTTLLDFLNNRTNKSPRKNLYLNKKKWTENEFKKLLGTVSNTPTYMKY